MTIIDNEQPGSGLPFDHSLIAKHQDSLIAGGITAKLAYSLRKKRAPLGFDTASGIETNGQIDEAKIVEFSKLFA